MVGASYGSGPAIDLPASVHPALAFNFWLRSFGHAASSVDGLLDHAAGAVRLSPAPSPRALRFGRHADPNVDLRLGVRLRGARLCHGTGMYGGSARRLA